MSQLQDALAKLRVGDHVLRLGGGNSEAGGAAIVPLASQADLQSTELQPNTLYTLPEFSSLTRNEQILDEPQNSN